MRWVNIEFLAFIEHILLGEAAKTQENNSSQKASKRAILNLVDVALRNINTIG